MVGQQFLCSKEDEKRVNCRRRNILYENRCELCKEGLKDGRTTSSLKDGKGIYVGKSSRSLHERAKEHEADRRNMSEDSHQIKHWLCDHPDLLAPPKFKFSIIRSFNDPLSRQLSEALKIELRVESILNSKSEFSRCRVPRLKEDLEGWMVKKAREKVSSSTVKKVSSQEEGKKFEQEEEETKEAEDTLEEVEKVKRKPDDQGPKRKTKRRKLEKLIGWGEGSSHQEDQGDSVRSGEIPDVRIDVTNTTMDMEKTRQTSIVDWVGVPEAREDEIVP